MPVSRGPPRTCRQTAAPPELSGHWPPLLDQRDRACRSSSRRNLHFHSIPTSTRSTTDLHPRSGGRMDGCNGPTVPPRDATTKGLPPEIGPLDNVTPILPSRATERRGWGWGNSPPDLQGKAPEQRHTCRRLPAIAPLSRSEFTQPSARRSPMPKLVRSQSGCAKSCHVERPRSLKTSGTEAFLPARHPARSRWHGVCDIHPAARVTDFLTVR